MAFARSSRNLRSSRNICDLWTFHDTANGPAFQAQACQLLLDTLGEVLADHQHHSDSHVEDTVHLRVVDPSKLLQPGEDGWNGPTVSRDFRGDRGGKDARQVFMQPAARDVSDPVDHRFHFIVTEHSADGLGIDACRLQEQLAHGLVA